MDIRDSNYKVKNQLTPTEDHLRIMQIADQAIYDKLLSLKFIKIIPTISVFAFALAALSYRIFFGVDLGDESVHLGIGYLFVLGAEAFKNEGTVGQMFAFFTFPLLKGLHFFNPSNEYIVVEMRFFYLLSRIAFSLLLLSTLRAFFSIPNLIISLASLTILVFVPANVFSLHYASLGFLFLGSSLCFNYLGIKYKKNLLVLASGIFLGFAAISHPGIFLASLFMFFAPKIGTRLRLTGFAGAWLLIMWIFDFSVFDYLQAAFATKNTITQNGTNLGLIKAVGMFSGLFPKGPLAPLLLLWITAFIAFCKKPRMNWNFSLLLLFPILVFFNSRASQGGIGSAGYVLSLTYLAPILCGHLYDWRKTQDFLQNFWIPSFLAFMGCSFLSTGGVAGTSGMLITVMPFSLIFFAEALKKNRQVYLPFFQKEILYAVPIFLFLIFFIRGTFKSVYQENTLEHTLSSKVTTGPFKGLKTTEMKKHFIESLESDLKSLPIKQGRIVFSCFLPAGYLLTTHFPNHSSLWFAPSLTQIKPNTDIVVRIFDETYPKINVWPQHCEALPETIAGQKGTLIKKQDYEIWVKNESIGSNLEKQL